MTWSAEVISYDTLVDQERKYLEKSTPRVRAALKSADLELYDVRPHAMRAVPFAMHLLVDQALLRIHQEVPISFAVRGCGSRDKPTAWHTWSLTQCTDTLARIRGFLEAAPRSYFPAEDGWAYIAPWLRATTHLVRACSAKPSLSKLDDSAKSSLRDVITLAIAHATLPTESRTSSAAAIAITEARGALVGLGEKLGAAQEREGSERS